jgi:hypothetical protein
MNQRPFYKCCLTIVAMIVVTSCKKDAGSATVLPPERPDTAQTDLVNLKFTVEPAGDWSQLFNRTSGWFGGDGRFSIPLSGVDSIGAGQTGKTFLLFSDTQVGEINNGLLVPGWSIINNSVAVIEGNEPLPAKLNFFWKTTATNAPAAVFVPNTPLALPGDYFWLGDGFVNQALGHETTILCYKIRRVNSGFGFAVMGSSIITIPAGGMPPFANFKQIDAPLFVEGDRIDNGYAFGAGIFVNTAEAGAP